MSGSGSQDQAKPSGQEGEERSTDHTIEIQLMGNILWCDLFKFNLYSVGKSLSS
jgi:hypothetical protein